MTLKIFSVRFSTHKNFSVKSKNINTAKTHYKMCFTELFSIAIGGL